MDKFLCIDVSRASGIATFNRNAELSGLRRNIREGTDHVRAIAR